MAVPWERSRELSERGSAWLGGVVTSPRGPGSAVREHSSRFVGFRFSPSGLRDPRWPDRFALRRGNRRTRSSCSGPRSRHFEIAQGAVSSTEGRAAPHGSLANAPAPLVGIRAGRRAMAMNLAICLREDYHRDS